MTWELTWGRQLEFLEGLAATGVPVQALQDRPTLKPHLWYYRDIYDGVAGSRAYTSNGEPLPVPVSEIHAYFQMFGINTLAEREVAFKMVRALDRAFLDVAAKQAEKAAKTPPQKR